MASSPTDICNLALGHLGEQRITSLDADNATARACNLHYEATRDQLFRAHRWNFAQARATLTRLADAPLFGWSYQYQLPADCLRVLEVNDSELGDVITDEYIIEQGKILTNADAVNLVYVQRIEDVTQFDPLFVDALAVKLAVVLSETVRGTTGKTEALVTLYEKLTAPLARRVDANEGRRRKGLLSLNSLFVRERGSSGMIGGTATTTSSGNAGTVTSVSGTGTVNGLTLTGTITTSGSLTLGGTLDLSSPPAIGGTVPAAAVFTTLKATSLPTSDPAVAGQLWSNGGVVMVSAG